jgi:hypothetical protein
MKSYLFFFLCIAFISHPVNAQDSAVLKKISFRITILDPENKETKGWLSQINDSSVEISNRSQHFARPSINHSYSTIDYSRVSAIKLKRNNGAGRGAIIGALTGLVIGVAAGLISGDDERVPANQDLFGLANAFKMTAGEKALVGGIAGGAVGAGLGALMGTLIKKTFIIDGKKEKFDEMRLNVLDKAYRKK